MIKKIVGYFRANSLISGTFIVLTGATISNLGNYLYHLAMGRMLGPIDYGILESLISLTYFLGIPISVLTLVVVKFVSENKKEIKKVALFIQAISRRITPYGFIVLAIFLLFFPLLKTLVKINSFFLFLGLAFTSFISIYTSILSATLQGIMKFVELGVFNVISSWLRLLIVIVVVSLGGRVGGVVYAGVLSSLICLGTGVYLTKKYLPLDVQGEIRIRDSFRNLKSYSLAILLSNLSLISFFTADIILARFFLPPLGAGQYASLSILSKIIFFASSPVVNVMFPMVSERQANGENFQKLLWGSVLIVVLISLFVDLIYFLFPRSMILILFGDKYLDAAPYLGLFAVFISVYSICSLFMNFYLSISKTKIIYSGVFFAVFQIVLINFYHQSIQEIIEVNIITLSLFLACLVIYYAHTFGLKFVAETCDEK